MRAVTHLLIVLTVIVSMLFTTCAATFAQAESRPSVERLTVSDARDDQSSARTDGRWVVYEDGRRSSPVGVDTSGDPDMSRVARVVTDQADIRARNLDTGQERRLTDASNARSPDVSGDLAVWSELGNDGRWSVVIYDLEDRSIVRRIDRDGNQQFPTISGQRVVWQDNRRGNWDIRAYDLDARREFWVSDSSQAETNPSIDGALVAFERDGLIWYRDLAANRLERIPGIGGYEPSVSGDRIAFRSGGTRSEPRDASIYVFDRRDGSLVQVSSTLDARRGNPRIQGDVVVWWDRRNGDRDVYAYDLVSKLEFAIATNAGDQDQPDVTAGSPYLMVWTDWRNQDSDIRGARVSLSTVPAEPITTPVVPVVTQPIAVDPNPIAPRDARYFPPTGFRIDNDQIWEYFQIRGGVKNFGYPTSRTFTFLGYTTQFFQRHIVQVGPEGPRLMNLLDPELMPYTTINTSTFPAYDPGLARQAPPVGSPGYDRAIVDFVRQHAPDEYAVRPVQFGSPSLLVSSVAAAGTIWSDANQSYPRYQSPAS
jgi:beta propeller repeat protein